MTQSLTATTLSITLALSLTACDLIGPEAPAPNEVIEGPIEGLTGDQARLHLTGDVEFARRFSVSDGLGPIFVATSCEQCHVGDGKGHPTFNLTRFGRMTGDGFDPMTEFGGPQLQHRAVPGYTPEMLPAGATGVAQFMAPAVTGLGYLEAVPDTVLLRLADPEDIDGDGISGRVQLVKPSEVATAALALEGPVPGERGTQIDGLLLGRFGKKAGAVNLLHQTVVAYQQDMGVTSDLLPEDLFNTALGSRATDDVPDPEVPSSTVASVVFYLKTLRIPERREPDHPDVLAGEQHFASLGCAACHAPTLTTGSSTIAALNRVTIHPYTDLLLHDMGSELDDGYTEGRATSSEWRTPPLWGLGLQASLQGGQAFFLHDGRASTLREAIELHGGEAAASRAGFANLAPNEQQQLIRFLESL